MHELPELGYDYDSLEPYIDEKTMRIHHGKHHQAYVDKLNKALDGSGLENKKIWDLIKELDSVPESIRQDVRDNGGGHLNHSLFWPMLKKDVVFGGEIAKAITERWDSLDKWKDEFAKEAATRFGSGWAWLVIHDGKLDIMSTPNQDNPISEGKIPILGLDVWEHAYYLKYQNKRPEYIKAFFNLINWDKANTNLIKAKALG